MMKMVMIIYNEAIDAEVTEVLKNCGLKNYTKLPGVFGSGATSGIHEGNDIWPGMNNILYIACEEKAARQMLICVKELRKKIGKEGVKAFILPVEDLT
jgi:nitrogen regulatory protein PII